MSLNKWSNEEFRCWEPNRRFQQQFQTSQVQSEKQYENRGKFIKNFLQDQIYKLNLKHSKSLELQHPKGKVDLKKNY